MHLWPVCCSVPEFPFPLRSLPVFWLTNNDRHLHPDVGSGLDHVILSTASVTGKTHSKNSPRISIKTHDPFAGFRHKGEIT